MSWNIFLSNFLCRWNRPDIDNMSRRKGKTHFSWGLFSSSSPSTKIYVCFRKPGKAVTTKWQKTVYMFSNIFVLYYIQLSLLKWITDDYYIAGQRKQKVNCAKCFMSPAGLWHDRQMLSLPWFEREMVDWCCLKGALPWVTLLSLLPWSKAFYPEHSDSHSPCTTQCVESENCQPKVRHFYWSLILGTKL